MNISNAVAKSLTTILWCVVSAGCGADDYPQKKEIFKNSKPNVKYSTFEKDGKKYASYDFGKAVFTVDKSYLNISDESTTEMRWYWPGLEPIGARGNTGEDTGKFSVVRIAADFSDANHYPDAHRVLERENLLKGSE